MTLKRMSIKVSEDLYEWIQLESEKRGLSMNAVIIFALETYYNQSAVIPNIAIMKEMMDKMDEQSTSGKVWND